MSDRDPSDAHVRPFVFESRGARALHFSINEIQSRMKLDDPDALDLEYTRTMMGVLLFVPEPHRIVMVGLGGGSLAKFCHRHLPQAQISVVEINPHVIALRDEFDIPADSDRFSVVLGDGALYMRQLVRQGVQQGMQPVVRQVVGQTAGGVDLLLIDGFDWEGLPDGLGAQRFFDDCHAALLPDGFLVMNLHLGDLRYEVVLDRIRRSFDGAVLAVDDADRSNSIVFACKGRTLASYRPGIVRPPPGLRGDAAVQLLGGFAQVVTALKAQRQAGRTSPHRDTP